MRALVVSLARFLAAALVAGFGITGPAVAQLERSTLKFSQGWLFQSTQSQFPLAVERGYWRTEGLEVTVDRGAGSAASVQRVVAGSHDLAFADIGTLVKWNAENPGKELVAVYVVEDGFPLVAVSMKSRGITRPKDLEGRRLGAPTFDGGRQMFPALAKANGLDSSRITWITMDANLRETMLARGEVDVITGFLTSVVPSLAGLGVKATELSILRYDDFNLDGFGNAVFGTREFVEKNPRTVTAFVKGLNRAMKDVIAEPQAALAAIKSRDPLVNLDLEAERLKLHVRELLLTPNVRQNGFSAVDLKKMERQIASVLDAFNVKATMPVSAVWTDRFLPPRAERMPPPYKD
jgi:NitT/TauT family transport system substrate-binding protein